MGRLATSLGRNRWNGTSKAQNPSWCLSASATETPQADTEACVSRPLLLEGVRCPPQSLWQASPTVPPSGDDRADRVAGVAEQPRRERVGDHGGAGAPFAVGGPARAWRPLRKTCMGRVETPPSLYHGPPRQRAAVPQACVGGARAPHGPADVERSPRHGQISLKAQSVSSQRPHRPIGRRCSRSDGSGSPLFVRSW